MLGAGATRVADLEHPQVTEAQVELWLASPVTKTFLRCLEWKRLDTVDAAGSGKLIDSSSADLTHALLHRSLGQQDVYYECGRPEPMLDFYEMIFHPPEEEETDE